MRSETEPGARLPTEAHSVECAQYMLEDLGKCACATQWIKDGSSQGKSPWMDFCLCSGPPRKLPGLGPRNRTATLLTPLVSLWVPCLHEDLCLPGSEEAL